MPLTLFQVALLDTSFFKSLDVVLLSVHQTFHTDGIIRRTVQSG